MLEEKTEKKNKVRGRERKLGEKNIYLYMYRERE